MMRILLAVSATIALLPPGRAAAQDTPRFGVVMGFPTQVGVVGNLADRLAIRPEVNWTHTTTESVTTSPIFTGTGLTPTSVTTTSEPTSIGLRSAAGVILFFGA